jgi:hypothetical protein
MAVNPTVQNVSKRDDSVKLATWNLTTATPDGEWIELDEWADRTWQATGTFGGATVAFQGSNDGVNAFPLTNVASGSALTLTTTGGAATIELPRYVRPNLTVVGVGAIIAVTLLLRRQKRN